MLNIKIKLLNERAKLPQRMTEHSSGYDLYSANEKDVLIKPGKIVLLPTGISISIPEGYEAQVRPRSGLAINHGIGVLNSPGTIDADYRGEIKVILFNFGDNDFIVTPSMRIAQLVLAKCEAAVFIASDSLEETDRGTGGFGFTKLS